MRGGNLFPVEDADSGETPEMHPVECQNACHRIQLHYRYKMRIMRLLTNHTVRGHDVLPSLQNLSRVGQNAKELPQIAISPATRATVIPKPFSLRGRVATPQNSTRF